MSSSQELRDFDELMRWDLMTFIHRCFLELNPGLTLSEAAHLRVIAARVSDCLLGRGSRRLIIALPPRSLKSISVSVAAVAWALGLDPTRRIICASYAQDLADKHARDTRIIMDSPFYERLFPTTKLSSRKAVADFETTQGGCRLATSVNGVLTGRGGDILILDDILKADDAFSDTKREGVNQWYDNTLLSRLNNKQTGVIIIVMQRLHQSDLIGHVLEKDNDWEVLSFPAIAEEDEEFVVQTAIYPYQYKRKAGDVLDPSRESREDLEKTKKSVGIYTFSSQYQQDPTPVGGAIVQTDWLEDRYDITQPLPSFTTVVQSWDTANKCGELNDYSVCTTWGYVGGHFYLLDVLRKRLNFPDLLQAVANQIVKHKPRTVLVEDRASGTQIIQTLRSAGHLMIKPYSPPPQTDKVIRLHAQTAPFEAKKVLLPTAAPWLETYIRELISFPGTKFDDQVDSTTQALEYMRKYGDLEVWARLGEGFRGPVFPPFNGGQF